MPATSAKQRAAMAIAEHDPSKLYAQNRGMLKLSQSQLHDFASTKGLGAPKGSASSAASASAPANGGSLAKTNGTSNGLTPKLPKPRQLSRPGNVKASQGLLSSNRKIQGIAKT